jgi:hypothetical protein
MAVPALTSALQVRYRGRTAPAAVRSGPDCRFTIFFDLSRTSACQSNVPHLDTTSANLRAGDRESLYRRLISK